ncbi:MAG: threonine--tRNA ligase, partial [Bacillales bacterium]|nr:threonine--tRNA ligase [Bacillales bacterium]
EPITLESKEAFHLLNHSGAHLMASAILNLFPETKFAIGPAIEEGFYYDMDLGRNITDEDLKAIEKEMNKVISANPTFIRENISKEKALEVFKDNKFKTEIINELEDGTITLYHLGKFTDLCSGPHVESAVKLRNFKLLSFSSAYWRGDQKRETLQRIYGVIQSSKEKLEEHLKMLEDAKNRDHRKLGKEMDIFFTHPLIGAGLPLWLPAGATLKRLLERYIQDKEIALGYDHVYTPVLATTSLYKTSGHWDHYKDNMFPIMKMDNEELVLRPMNCPHHMLVYKNSLHSYKDLPIKIGELAHDFRYEASGALLGIERVRAMCQNDAHLFVRADQIEEEFSNVVKLILDVYKDMNITKYSFRLSLRDPKDTEKYFPDDNMWNKAEDKLRQVLNDLKIPYEEAIGEAAFYGPKLDVQIRTALNHELTLSTCQLDFLLPERFDLTYIDPKGEKARPVVLHRAILGTTERFTAYLLEETKGVLPTWLSPLQVVVLPVNNEYHLEYAKLVNGLLKDNNIRAKVDFRDEKLGYKIREHQMAKVPFTLVIGDKELNEKSVTYRVRGSREEINVPIKNFIKLLEEEIKSKR